MKFNEVTWYSKLAAVILFIGIIPTLTFYIGMQYGEIVAMQETPVYTFPHTHFHHDEETGVSAASSAPQTQYFKAKQSTKSGEVAYSNIVGYFAGGNFFWYVPQWIPENWKLENQPNGGIKFVLQDATVKRNFSDIVIDLGTTTETNNAETLYTKLVPKDKKAVCISDTRCEVGTDESILASEILLSRVGDTRIYHVAQVNAAGIVTDKYYIDGNSMTTTITFSAPKGEYGAYSSIIRDFVQGIGKGKGAQG